MNTNDPEALISNSIGNVLDLYLHGFGQGSAGLIALLLSQLEFITLSDDNFENLSILDKKLFKPRCIQSDFNVLDKNGSQFSAYQMMLEYFNYSEKLFTFARPMLLACYAISETSNI